MGDRPDRTAIHNEMAKGPRLCLPAIPDECLGGEDAEEGGVTTALPKMELLSDARAGASSCIDMGSMGVNGASRFLGDGGLAPMA